MRTLNVNQENNIMDFKLPEIGEGVYEAELVSWLVKPGEAVKRGQTLMEILTDKATMEVPAPFAGTIENLSVEPGQQVKIGDVLLQYQEAGGRKEEPEKPKEAKTAKPGKPPKPKVAEAEEGEEEGEKLPQAEEEKTEPKEAKPSPAKESKLPPAAKTVNGPSDTMPVRAAPSVRLMARQLGIDISRVRGSGPDRRILIEDLSRQIPVSVREPRVSPDGPPPDYGKAGQRIKFVGLRRKIAEHLVHAKRTIPHYSYVDECDVSELV